MSGIGRVFLIVLDSVGIGAMPDAAQYGDTGSNTLASVAATGKLRTPNLAAMGLYNIEGVSAGEKVAEPIGCFARLAEKSKGKDTTIGHWEIAGIISEKAMPTYPGGFPDEVIDALARATGRGILCNKPYSGTQVLTDYGSEHLKTGKLIVYTSADSVMQIAAHEGLIPPEQLYEICRTARKIMCAEHGVGRIIARPFIGDAPDFSRTSNRHDFSLIPPEVTMPDVLLADKLDVIGVGKISDIFAGKGIGRSTGANKNNRDGMEKTIALAHEAFNGLCFVNLVDFDMLYGHRNDADGYALALNEFDSRLGELLPLLCPDDVLMITADHGCDPGAPGTDHTREYVPLLVCGKRIRKGLDLGTRDSFADIAATVQEMLGSEVKTRGSSFFGLVAQE